MLPTRRQNRLLIFVLMVLFSGIAGLVVAWMLAH